MNGTVLLAQEDTPMGWSSPGSNAIEILLVVGVMLVVITLMFMWAAFWRKPRRRKHSYHRPGAELPRREKSKSSRLFRRHRRHRHRDDRPINPTLAQVGGLPPQRRDPPPEH